MKRMKWPVRAVIFIALIQLGSCTKAVDTTTNDSVSTVTSNDLTFPVANEFADCKIRNFFHEHSGISGMIVNGLFTYNKGNPISLTYNENGTGNPNHYFFYDKQGRLKEWRVTYQRLPDNDARFAESRHLYGYDAANKIVTDTFYDGIASAPVPYIYVITLTYDNQSRIIKENIRNIQNPGGTLAPTRNPTYTYDSRGNLAVAGWKSSSYDNKVSIFRSHPVFQFIFRNYSRNNAAPQIKYNSKGLPLSMYPGNDAFFNADPKTDAFSQGKGISRIWYDCQ